jgi:preprotein translocase subunit SecG
MTDLIGFILAGLLFVLALAVPFMTSERHKNPKTKKGAAQ